jgi:hypothetical protein
MGKGRDKRRIAKDKRLSKKPSKSQIRKIAEDLQKWAQS